LNLKWLLLDFGRRGSAWDAAKERLLAANLGFNRKHQQIAFGVQRAFYGLTSIRARIAVAQSSLDAARAVQEATESRLRNGLATRPELALARQQTAQAAFELEEVLDRERDAQVTLTESIGASPRAPIQVIDFSAQPAPATLQDSVEKAIDRALEKRPDLIAKVAALRASEAELSRARAAYWPTLSLIGDVGAVLGKARITTDGQSTGWFGATQPSYGIGLSFEWEIFDGGARRRRVELAESTRRGAQDEITATRDRAVSEVWKAYTDVKLAFRRLDVAAALVDASQQSYEDSLRSYQVGLGTLTDLLAARRELSRARFVELDTKVHLLESSAALAFTTGETPDTRSAPDR
jgi:outer membrane protein TolC